MYYILNCLDCPLSEVVLPQTVVMGSEINHEATDTDFEVSTCLSKYGRKFVRQFVIMEESPWATNTFFALFSFSLTGGPRNKKNT